MPSGRASSEEAAVATIAVAAVIQVAWRATFRKGRERSGGKRRWKKSKSAVQVCRELDNRVDAYPLQTSDDRGCVHRAVRNALANAPVGDGVDADYNGY